MAGVRSSSNSTLVLVGQLLLLLLASSLTYCSTTPVAPASGTKYYYVAVEGVVYCKTCKLSGYNKDIDASPLPGAIVKLRCSSTARRSYEITAKTDENGYFYVEAPPKVLNSGMTAWCRVFLVSSPVAACKKPTDHNGGVSGARLRYERIISRGKKFYALYTSDLLLFGPTYSNSCPKTTT